MSIISNLTTQHAAQRIFALHRMAQGAGDRTVRNAAAHAAKVATADLAKCIGWTEALAAVARAANPRTLDDVAVVERDGALVVLE
jgi:hypothetical protein